MAYNRWIGRIGNSIDGSVSASWSRLAWLCFKPCLRVYLAVVNEMDVVVIVE